MVHVTSIIHFNQREQIAGYDLPWALWASPVAVVEHCISQPKQALALTITDFITDMIIMIIPIPLVGDRFSTKRTTLIYVQIWQLNLKPAKKIAITAVFLLGAG